MQPGQHRRGASGRYLKQRLVALSRIGARAFKGIGRFRKLLAHAIKFPASRCCSLLATLHTRPQVSVPHRDGPIN